MLSQKKKKKPKAENTLLTVWYSKKDKIMESFKILMFSFSVGSIFSLTFLPIIAVFTIAICSIDIYDVKALAYYFMKANLAPGMNW